MPQLQSSPLRHNFEHAKKKRKKKGRKEKKRNTKTPGNRLSGVTHTKENCVLSSAACCYQTPRKERYKRDRVTSCVWQRGKRTPSNMRHHLEGAKHSRFGNRCFRARGGCGMRRTSSVFTCSIWPHSGNTYTCHRPFHGGYTPRRSCHHHHSQACKTHSAYHAWSTPLVFEDGIGQCRSGI